MEEFFPYVKDVDMNKLKITEEGRYSVSKPEVSILIQQYILKKIGSIGEKTRGLTIVDGTGNVGGDTIGFGLNNNFNSVLTTETNKENYDVLVNNVKVYKLEDKVKLYNEDFVTFLKNMKENYCDIIYFDPPWGGKDYKFKAKLSLFMSKINVGLLVKDMKSRKLCKYVVLKIPFNFNITAFQNLAELDDISIYNIPNSSVYMIFVQL